MSQALYRKYRSKSLDELVGQDHIVRALSASIKSGKISHAYLFTGPRGTGKTSVARILAHDLNGIAYDESATNIDIIEIDAASNRRIDEIRDLREKVHIAPTNLKYKVYIIDEVHMLTKEAFNALLKTLEEPPQHVIFILATTELHKVPDTIISRTQRYSFRPIEQSKLVSHLTYIADQEKIPYDKEALEIIAEHAEGGFRDAIGLLDQVRHTSDKITAESVMETLGMPPHQSLDQLWLNLQSHSPSAATELNKLYQQGYHAPQIAKALLQKAITAADVEVSKKLLNVGSSFDPKTELLLIILEGGTTSSPATESPTQPKDQHHTTQKTEKKHPETIKPPALPANKAEEKPTITNIASDNSAKDEVTSPELWEKILNVIKDGKHSVYGPLRLAKATIANGTIYLGLAFPFHIKRINEQKNLAVIHEAIIKVNGEDLEVVIERLHKDQEHITVKPVKAHSIKPVPEPSSSKTVDPDAELMTDPLSIVKNVFGDAEVL